MQQDRDISFDAFRGIAIIAVIAIHACDTVFFVRYPQLGQWSSFLLVAYRELLNFAVPAFIFISGYWLSKREVKSLKDYKTFLGRRLPRVLVPYLFWSLIILGSAVIKTGDINIYQIIRKLLTGTASNVYYFIIVIVQLYIITPLLQYINHRPYGPMLIFILNAVYLSALYLSRTCDTIGHLPVYLPFCSWMLFYEIGLIIGNSDNKIFAQKNIHLFILPAILLSMLISEMEGMVLLSKYNNLSFAISPVKYSSFLYSICIIAGFLFIRSRVKYWPKFLVVVGNYSFGIYLIHIFVLKVVGIIQKINVIYSFQPLYQFIVVSMTVSICFVLISVAQKLLPESFCHKVLGFDVKVDRGMREIKT
ncbi:MAG: acyltransferase [Planctomycetota bacterium]|jgi:surface polysaccharide O-acyltransferase-like enzyme